MKELRAGSWSRNYSRNHGVLPTGMCPMNFSARFLNLGPTAGGTADRMLDPPTSIITQENAPSDGDTLSFEISFSQMTLAHGKLMETAQDTIKTLTCRGGNRLCLLRNFTFLCHVVNLNYKWNLCISGKKLLSWHQNLVLGNCRSCLLKKPPNAITTELSKCLFTLWCFVVKAFLIWGGV